MNQRFFIFYKENIDLKGIISKGLNGQSSLEEYLDRVPSIGFKTKYLKLIAIWNFPVLCKYPYKITGGVLQLGLETWGLYMINLAVYLWITWKIS